MAGRQRGEGRSPNGSGSGMMTPATKSPSGSMEFATMDLLTGLFPTRDLFGQGIAGQSVGGVGGANTSNSPAQTGVMSSNEGSPNIQDVMYESVLMQQHQHEPLDLLTGLFPPPSRTPSPVMISPTLATSTNGWRTDVLSGHQAFGGGSISNELFGSPVISRNNPFLDDAVIAQSLSPPSQPIPHRISDVGRVGWPDSSFAQFPPVAESLTNLDLGSRSQNTSPAPHPPGRVSRPQVVANEFSPSNGLGVSKYPSSSSLPQTKDSGSKSDTYLRHSSAPSGIGLERTQNGAQGAESPRRYLQQNNAATNKILSNVSPPQSEDLRRGSQDTKYDPRGLSIPGSSRTVGSESRPPELIASAAKDEFVSGYGTGIYKAPVRGAVFPSRPVSLELRPHPLKGALANNQVTKLSSLEGSLWAACEMGLMVWDVENATGKGSSGTGNILGDEDAASSEFFRVQGSSASCIVSDVANQVVWTGHRDGKIRAWSARDLNASRESRAALLVFQAHRPAVTALVFTSYGELWAGSESGELKAWPWDAVGKALSGTCDGTALMEKRYQDLRIGNFNAGPNGPLINPEIKFLVCDHAHGTVWCAGSLYISIWDARTRERLKTVGVNGMDLNSPEVGSPGKVILLDEDLKVGYAKVTTKREKGGWLQRSRNAVMGAADAVRRAASGGGQGNEDNRRLESLVATANGTIWGGYGNGILTKWDWEGYRLQEICMRPVGVKCICAVGNRLWVGYSDGQVLVIGETGQLVGRRWLAHRYAVIHMVLCGGHVYSLGLSGSIRGWNISSRDSNLEALLAEAMTNRANSYTSQRHLRVLAASWNTSQERASQKSVRTWLAEPAADASIVVVGLQEVEMGAGAIGMAAVKETVGLEKGSAAGLYWLGLVDTVLGNDFERVGSRQLAGMLIGVWVRRKLVPYVGDVEVGAVACGFGRALGNKGAVGVKLMIYRRNICFLTSHLAAHMEHVSRRNADFEHIYSQMSFSPVSRPNANSVGNAASGVSNAVQSILRGGGTSKRDQNPSFTEREQSLQADSDIGTEDAGLPELAEADLLVWTGDLNYRIDSLSYEEVLNYIKKRQWDILLSYDQLRHEMGNGRTFYGLREGPIRFQPTYKFDKYSDGVYEVGRSESPSVYDTSEKKRIPAWCDRVLFRDSFASASEFASSSKHGLARPCKATVDWYEACMEPDDSDHKPVRCMLNVEMSVIDEKQRRCEYGNILSGDPRVQACLAASGYIPEIVLSTNKVILEGSTPSILRLSNGDRQHDLLYVIGCIGMPSRGVCPCGQHSSKSTNKASDEYPRGSYGFPRWLQVVPATGVLSPCDSVKVILTAMKSEDRAKDLEDKVVVLVVKVKGAFSPDSKQYRICVSWGPTNRFGKEKEALRRRSQDLQGRSSSAGKDSQLHGSKVDHGSSDLLRHASSVGNDSQSHGSKLEHGSSDLLRHAASAGKDSQLYGSKLEHGSLDFLQHASSASKDSQFYGSRVEHGSSNLKQTDSRPSPLNLL